MPLSAAHGIIPYGECWLLQKHLSRERRDTPLATGAAKVMAGTGDRLRIPSYRYRYLIWGTHPLWKITPARPKGLHGSSEYTAHTIIQHNITYTTYGGLCYKPFCCRTHVDPVDRCLRRTARDRTHTILYCGTSVSWSVRAEDATLKREEEEKEEWEREKKGSTSAAQQYNPLAVLRPPPWPEMVFIQLGDCKMKIHIEWYGREG